MSHRPITGPLMKSWIDSILFFRLLFACMRQYGFISSFGALRSYLRDPRCLFRSNPNRYMYRSSIYLAVPDLPPLFSADFSRTIIRDIEWVKSGKAPGLLFCIFCISSRCPFRCSYCYNAKMQSTEEILDEETIMKAIGSLVQRRIPAIYLSGGEPLMRWELILKILKEFAGSSTAFWLLTTGWKMEAEQAHTLKKAGLRGVMISLDSDNAEEINAIKGKPGAFDYAVNALAFCRDAGLFTVIDCVFSKKLLSPEGFYNFVHFAGEAGAQFINCYIPRPGQREDAENPQAFGMEEARELQERIWENHHHKVYRKLPVAYSPDLWEAQRGCVGGKLFIYIDPSGQVKNCPFTESISGNIKHEEITSIINKITSQKVVNECAVNLLFAELGKE